MSGKFPIRGWHWIFYIYGWISGITNILFWALQIAFHFINQERQFFSRGFHKRVFYWGVFMFIVSLGIVLFMLSIAVLIPLIFGSL